MAGGAIVAGARSQGAVDEHASAGDRTRFLRREYEHLTGPEKHVLEHVQAHEPIARDTGQEYEEARTFGQRMSDRLAAMGGSWGFVIAFMLIMIAWVAFNSWELARLHRAFDPFPFILLNLVLSMLAAIQAPIIMMSQNRQAAKDRLDAAHDFEVNLKAEIEIRALHEKLDELRERSWAELVAMQQEQIRMLERLLHGRGETPPPAE